MDTHTDSATHTHVGTGYGTRTQALEAQCEEMATQLAARSLPAVVCLTWDATSGASADGWVFMPAVVVQLGDGDDEAEDGRTLTALGSDNRWCAHHPDPSPKPKPKPNCNGERQPRVRSLLPAPTLPG